MSDHENLDTDQLLAKISQLEDAIDRGEAILDEQLATIEGRHFQN